MINYIVGKLIEKNPAYLVVETNDGIGYYIHISVNTFSAIKNENPIKVFTHYVIKDDAQLLYGFATEDERQFFRLLISVNGVGVNTARLILSSLTASELTKAIVHEELSIFKGVKGVGPKIAQRIIIELKDKVKKISPISGENFLLPNNNTKNEALSGLVSLGFAKHTGEAMLEKIIQSEGSDLSVEELIKKALKML